MDRDGYGGVQWPESPKHVPSPVEAAIKSYQRAKRKPHLTNISRFEREPRTFPSHVFG